jgi:hypothetical protein
MIFQVQDFSLQFCQEESTHLNHCEKQSHFTCELKCL